MFPSTVSLSHEYFDHPHSNLLVWSFGVTRCHQFQMTLEYCLCALSAISEFRLGIALTRRRIDPDKNSLGNLKWLPPHFPSIKQDAQDPCLGDDLIATLCGFSARRSTQAVGWYVIQFSPRVRRSI